MINPTEWFVRNDEDWNVYEPEYGVLKFEEDRGLLK